MNFAANEKLSSTSKTSLQSYGSSFKSSKKLALIPSKFWELQPKWVPKQNQSTPETIQQQSLQQIFQTKDTLELVSPLKVYDNIITELQKDVQNFVGGNLRYFSKNWYKYAKNKCIFNVITSGLHQI